VDQSGTGEARVTVEEAAWLLGIEKGSVKKRIQRGKLRSERDASGTLYVHLDRSETVRDKPQGQSETVRDELVGELRDRVRSLESRLDEEKESRRRADTIIAQLTQANAALAARVPELEASSEQPEAPETAEEAPDRAEPRPATGEAQEGARRPWWRRVLGR
jgi:excisionase family DNA binding protein